MLVGIDGYKKGWIAAIELRQSETVVRTYPNFRSILNDGSLTLIIIDIPIGLLDHGARTCDVEARRLLGRARGSSVFPSPIRSMLDAGTWEEACRRRVEQERKKCSKQVAGILPKIREVDRGMTPTMQHRVREGHPELCFAMMKQGKPMSFNKRTKQGQKSGYISFCIISPTSPCSCGQSVGRERTSLMPTPACGRQDASLTARRCH